MPFPHHTYSWTESFHEMGDYFKIKQVFVSVQQHQMMMKVESEEWAQLRHKVDMKKHTRAALGVVKGD